jgi:hypothetical protein
VWDFWDSTSTSSNRPYVAKIINIGGQPTTDELHFSCRPVGIDGQSVLLRGTITANNPPTILPGVSISVNDAFFTYQTQIRITAIDQDRDDFNFSWYSDDVLLGNGNSSYIGELSGTWAGNGTRIIDSYPGTLNCFDLTVSREQTVTCYIVDERQGTTSIDFELRGKEVLSPAVKAAINPGGIVFDASMPYVARIGAGQTVDFSVFTAPPLSDYSFLFNWSFAGSNGWTMLPIMETGVTVLLPNGGFQNTVHRDISTEVVSSGTSKGVTAAVRVTLRNDLTGEMVYTDIECDMVLVANQAPNTVAIQRLANGAPITGPVAAGTKIQFIAAGTDPNLDVMFYRWRFNQPFAPATAYFYGPKVLYDTTGYTSSQSVQGELTVYDRLNAELSVVLPVTTIS